MAELDRDYLIEQLEKLGSEDDEAVLAAARAAHNHVRDSGFTWDDVLEPDYDEDDFADEDDDDAADDDRIDDDEESDGAWRGNGDDDAPAGGADETEFADSDDGRLIDRLLEHEDVMDDTREDLSDMKTDLSNGELSTIDRRFIRALAKRLGVR